MVLEDGDSVARLDRELVRQLEPAVARLVGELAKPLPEYLKLDQVAQSTRSANLASMV